MRLGKFYLAEYTRIIFVSLCLTCPSQLQSDKINKLRKERQEKEERRRAQLAAAKESKGLSEKTADDEKRQCAIQKRREQGAVKKTGNALAISKTNSREEKEQKITKRKRAIVVSRPLRTGIGARVTKPKGRTRCVEQGGRKMPVPCDQEGCKHSGLTELKELSRRYLKAYLKKGGVAREYAMQGLCYQT